MSSNLPQWVQRTCMLFSTVHGSHEENGAGQLLLGKTGIAVSCWHLPLIMSHGKCLELLIMKSNTVQFNFHQTAAGLKQSCPQEIPQAKSRNCALSKGTAGRLWNEIEFIIFKKGSSTGLCERPFQRCWKASVVSLTQHSNWWTLLTHLQDTWSRWPLFLLFLHRMKSIHVT